MKVIGKILKILGILLLSLVLLLAAADAAWIYVPQIKAAKRIDDVDAYAAPVEALTVREGAGIIALGEATHGNAEFQRLRRDVLERLTEEYGVRSFALEADFGEAAGVDEYIKGGAGTAAGALLVLAFSAPLLFRWGVERGRMLFVFLMVAVATGSSTLATGLVGFDGGDAAGGSLVWLAFVGLALLVLVGGGVIRRTVG